MRRTMSLSSQRERRTHDLAHLVFRRAAIRDALWARSALSSKLGGERGWIMEKPRAIALAGIASAGHAPSRKRNKVVVAAHDSRISVLEFPYGHSLLAVAAGAELAERALVTEEETRRDRDDARTSEPEPVKTDDVTDEELSGADKV